MVAIRARLNGGTWLNNLLIQNPRSPVSRWTNIGSMHEYKKQRKGRGPVGKAAVVGAKDRETNQVTAMPVACGTSPLR